jgi:hypothetical protein
MYADSFAEAVEAEVVIVWVDVTTCLTGPAIAIAGIVQRPMGLAGPRLS